MHAILLYQVHVILTLVCARTEASYNLFIRCVDLAATVFESGHLLQIPCLAPGVELKHYECRAVLLPDARIPFLCL